MMSESDTLNVEEPKAGREGSALLDLPAVVLDGILDRLDTTSLKTLRLVCRTTNSLIERPKYLQNYWMHITSNNLHEILNSPAKYPNCVIKLNRVTNWNALTPFLRHSQAWLSNLKIHIQNMHPKEAINILLNTGTQLRSFTTNGILHGRLFGKQWFEENRSAAHLSQELQELQVLVDRHESTLKQILIGLQEFNLENTGREERQATICLMKMFLKCCPALVTINVPIFRQGGLQDNFQYNQHLLPIDVDDDRHLDKLFDYLKEISSNGAQAQRLSKINFWSRTLQYPQVMAVQRYKPILRLTDSTLTQLLKLCDAIKVKLYNVPISALPNTVNCTRHEKKLLEEGVASVLSGPRIPADFKNVPSGCPINLMISDFRCNNEHETLEPVEHLNIASITLIYDTMENSNMKRIMSSVLSVNRPTVSELSLYGHRAVKAFKAHGLSHFPNLKKLNLHGNPDRYSDDLNRTRIPGAVITLSQLDSMELEFIEVQFDDSLGEDEMNGWIAKTRQLQHFRLNNCKFKSVPDEVINPPQANVIDV